MTPHGPPPPPPTRGPPAGRGKDELIEAQKQVIGILFEVVKRLQANNDLDMEYLQMVSAGKAERNRARLDEILSRRRENAEVAGRLLEKLEA